MMQNKLTLAVRTALLAGIETLNFYRKNIQVEMKEDNSPLTLADKCANETIINLLEGSKIPVLTEESEQIAYDKRKDWLTYWLIDPLDGTKEFINKSDEYTVNIALMENNYPTLGVVYAPAKDILYYGSQETGAFKVKNASEKSINELFIDSYRTKLPVSHNQSIPVIIASKSHLNAVTTQYISRYEDYYEKIKIENYGSSLKLCMIAEGTADLYPRLGPTMEWDTAASHAIVEAAGMFMLQYPKMIQLEYNKKDMHNPYFIVFNNKISKVVKELSMA